MMEITLGLFLFSWLSAVVECEVDCTQALIDECVNSTRLVPTDPEATNALGSWITCGPAGCPYPDEVQCSQPHCWWTLGCCGCYKSKTMKDLLGPSATVSETIQNPPTDCQGSYSSWTCTTLESGGPFKGLAMRTPLETPDNDPAAICKCTDCTFVTSSPKNGDMLWWYPTRASTEASVAVAEDGDESIIYYADDYGNAYAITHPTTPLPPKPEGTLIWKLRFLYDDGIQNGMPDILGGTAPTVVGSDVWFSGTASGRLYKVDQETGTIKCYTDLRARVGGWGFMGSSAVSGDGSTIYIGSGDTCESGAARFGDSIYAVRTSDCKLMWTFQATDGTIGIAAFIGGPIVDKHGVIIGASQNGYVYRLRDDGSSYTLLAKFSVGATDMFSRESIFAPPSLADDGTIYFGSNANKVFALPPNFSNGATPKWTFGTDGEVFQLVTVRSGGYLYFGCEDGILYCLKDLGSSYQKVWEFQAPPSGRWVTRCIITAKPGKTNLVCNDQSARNYWALDITNPDVKPSGFLWELKSLAPAGGEVVHSPSVDSNGILYLPGGDCLYAVYGDMPLDTSSPWPMYHHDPQFSGNAKPPPDPTEEPDTEEER